MAAEYVKQLVIAFLISLGLTSVAVALVLGILMGIREGSLAKGPLNATAFTTIPAGSSLSTSTSVPAASATTKGATVPPVLSTSKKTNAPTAATSAPTTTTAGGRPDPRNPHIVVIIADDLGWNDVAFRYPGRNQMYTPNIDKLHKEGLNLMNSYMHPVCTPSRAAFMTGKYAFRYGMQSDVLSALDNFSLPLNLTTMPNQFQALGYTTRLVGKWHLGYCNPSMTPTRRGFDSFFGMYNGMADYFNFTSKWDGYDLHDDAAANGSYSYRVAWEFNGNYSTHVYTNKALELLEKHDTKKPLFLVLSYQAVHGPLETPQSYVDQYCANVTQSEDRKIRCAMTAAMDEGIGNVTAALDRLGFSDNLVTLFISDNGGPVSEASSNWPLRGSKITLWEGGTKAVTILHSKSHLPKVFQAKNSSEWNGLMHGVDWYPTLLRAAGYNGSVTGIDGVDNWLQIVNQTDSSRQWFVYNVNDDKNNSAIRYNNYKLIHNGGGNPDGWYTPPDGLQPTAAPSGKKPEYQLYDLSIDEGETTNIVDNVTLQGIVNKMKTELLEVESQIQPSDPFPSLEAGKPQYHNLTWVTGWC